MHRHTQKPKNMLTDKMHLFSDTGRIWTHNSNAWHINSVLVLRVEQFGKLVSKTVGKRNPKYSLTPIKFMMTEMQRPMIYIDMINTFSSSALLPMEYNEL